ncbi:type IV pilus assembly protein PilE [Elusimicrobium posterum]|uniref:type IV pilin protein n=1 Tax=Elusimicrobium posterum TaxID=3116653 RepID=UPI003C7272E1
MKKGFTLIELLVVVLIIGILAAIALPQYTKAVEKARAAEAITLIKSMKDGIEMYMLQHNERPTKIDDLDIAIPSNTKYTYSISTDSPGSYFYLTARNVAPSPTFKQQDYTIMYFINNKSKPDYDGKMICMSVNDKGKKACSAIGTNPHGYLHNTAWTATYINY